MHIADIIWACAAVRRENASVPTISAGPRYQRPAPAVTAPHDLSDSDGGSQCAVELGASDPRQRAIVDAARDRVVISDEHGRVTYSNSQQNIRSDTQTARPSVGSSPTSPCPPASRRSSATARAISENGRGEHSRLSARAARVRSHRLRRRNRASCEPLGFIKRSQRPTKNHGLADPRLRPLRSAVTRLAVMLN